MSYIGDDGHQRLGGNSASFTACQDHGWEVFILAFGYDPRPVDLLQHAVEFPPFRIRLSLKSAKQLGCHPSSPPWPTRPLL